MFARICKIINTLTNKYSHTIHRFAHTFEEWCMMSNLYITLWLICCVISVYKLVCVLTYKIHKLVMVDDKVRSICAAIESNDIVESLRLLKQNSDCINKPNSLGYTPFMIACANGNTQLTKYMLAKGADVTKKSERNESPFYLAAFYYIKNPQVSNSSCIRELYYAGADINEPNAKGFNPLQMAAMFGHSRLVQWLLLKKAILNTKPHPYSIAFSQGHQETAMHIKNWEKYILSQLALNQS